MTIKDFFSQSSRKGIILQFQELNMSPDIIINYLGKDKKAVDSDLYEIKNKYFENSLLIKHNNKRNEYFVSCYSDYIPSLSEDIISFVNSKFDTKILIKKKLEDILENINYFSEKLKDFNETRSLMDIDDIKTLNQIYKALNMPNKEIIINKDEPHSTWMMCEFFIVDNLDEIKCWIQTQIDLS